MIERLENNEQILLMYLADELPVGDRADVDRMLSSDPSLRRDCDRLKSLHAIVGGGLERLDDLTSLPVNGQFVVRQVGRAIRQKMARPKVAAPPTRAAGQPRSWWWLYPTVAAASIAIVAMVWLNHQPTPTSMPPTIVPRLPDSPDQLADSGETDDDLLLDSFAPPTGSDLKDLRLAEDDRRKQLTSVDNVAQDEISQYLLAATATVK